MSKKKKRNRLLLKLILEKIDDDISSLTNFREKEKNTSQLLNFDFFNLLSNTGLRVSNIALLISTGDGGQIPFSSSTTNRGKNTHRTKRGYAFPPLHDFPLSMDDTRPRSGYRRGMRLTDAASEIEKSKRRPPPFLSLSLSNCA